MKTLIISLMISHSFLAMPQSPGKRVLDLKNVFYPGYYMIGYSYADSTNRYIGYGNVFITSDTLHSHENLVKIVQDIRRDAFHVIIVGIYRFVNREEYLMFIKNSKQFKQGNQ